MAIYFGTGEKVKLNINNTSYSIIIKPIIDVIEEVLLSSSDDYLLQDVNGLYLAPKEGN